VAADRGTLLAVLSAVLAAVGVDCALASSYDERRAAAVKACEAIDAAQYQTGLAFNPAGYRSYYVRSECFQKAAVRFRDAALCARVKQRRALFSSSWGYSAGNCRTLVAAAVAADRRELEEVRRTYLAGHMTLRDFRIEPNGNGRDFDIVPVIAGRDPHGYTLRFAIAPAEGSGPAALIHANGYWVDTTPLRIYVRRADIQQRVPGFFPNRPYTVVATMIFGLPTTTIDAERSDEFVESVFPARERSQSVTKLVAFPGGGG
jgi:hypothetical protein